MKDVQCYELFGGIALKDHAFSFSINDGRSMLAMFLTVLYKVEGLETETLK